MSSAEERKKKEDISFMFSMMLALARWGCRGSGAWLTLRAKVGRAAEGYQLRQRQRGGHTQQRSEASTTEWRKGSAMRLKDPPKRRKSRKNAALTEADDGG